MSRRIAKRKLKLSCDRCQSYLEFRRTLTAEQREEHAITIDSPHCFQTWESGLPVAMCDYDHIAQYLRYQTEQHAIDSGEDLAEKLTFTQALCDWIEAHDGEYPDEDVEGDESEQIIERFLGRWHRTMSEAKAEAEAENADVDVASAYREHRSSDGFSE